MTMLFLLYYSGKKLSINYHIISPSGLLAIMAYTLNEGLRFGRGVDYNLYWQKYIDLSKGWDTHQNIGFLFIEKIFIFCGIPFQGLIIFMSFMFILGTLLLFKQYKEIVAFGLPIWVLLSLSFVENMVRWYLAFSLILIGLSFVLNNDNHRIRKYICFSIIGCFIHYAIIPIPIVFYWLSSRNKPLMKPKVAIVIFIMVVLFFKSNMMLPLASLINSISFLSNNFTGYTENIEFWLTNNALGVETIGITMMQSLFFIFLIFFGYKCSINAGKKYVFAYNAFFIGAILFSVGSKIELMNRYDSVFYFFSAIVFACIIKMIILYRVEYREWVMALVLFFLVTKISHPIRVCIDDSSFKYMYVWDRKSETPNSMLNMYMMDNYRQNSQYESKDARMRRTR